MHIKSYICTTCPPAITEDNRASSSNAHGSAGMRVAKTNLILYVLCKYGLGRRERALLLT